MSAFTVQNESGQVVSFNLDGDTDPRKAILEQRIARGELTKASTSTKSAARVGRNRVAVVDEHTGVRDEKGDLLKSIHGGGNDPDARGDELGQPSGSEKVGNAVDATRAGNEVGEAGKSRDAAKSAPSKS